MVDPEYHLPRTSNTGVLPLGSDFPVEGINPLLGFYAAVSRLSPLGDSPHGPQGWCGPSCVVVDRFIDS
jgi:predicted amidohydrolase YtcJ